jgi:RNA polymerase sigma-70 factor, ECF subfamily
MLTIYLNLLDTNEDKVKFEQLYLEYRYVMLYVARQILHDDMLAEDAVHEAFLILLKNLDKIDEVTCKKTKAYIVIIAKNKAIDMLRHNRHEAICADPVENIEDPTFQPEDILINKETLQQLKTCLSSLDETYRIVLELRYFCELSPVEIAESLDITRENVDVRLYRAKKLLYKEYQKRK